MTDDIVTRLTISGDHSPSQCWGCGEWGCTNSEGEPVPCYCENQCSHDNNCDCDCHEWNAIVNDAKSEIEHLREQNEYLKANIEMLLAEARQSKAEARQSKYGIENMYE